MDAPVIGRRRKRDEHPTKTVAKDASDATSSVFFASLAPLNARVEHAWQNRSSRDRTAHPGFMDEAIWDTWLWGEDPLEEAPVGVMLNRMQLLGLLIARSVHTHSHKAHQSPKP